MSLEELIAFISGSVCVYLAAKEKPLTWPIGIVTAIVLTMIFWKLRFYGQMLFQIVYIIESFYGWYKWSKKKTDDKEILKVKFTGKIQYIVLGVIGVISVLALGNLFEITGDPVPYADAFISVSSLLAEYMMCIKLYESWYIYILADIVAIVLCVREGLYLTAGTYIAFIIFGIFGIVEWRKSIKNSEGKTNLFVQEI